MKVIMVTALKAWFLCDPFVIPSACLLPGRYRSWHCSWHTVNNFLSFLWQEGKGSLAVRVALGETELVQNVRQFLLENGVSLDSFSQVSPSAVICQIRLRSYYSSEFFARISKTIGHWRVQWSMNYLQLIHA